MKLDVKFLVKDLQALIGKSGRYKTFRGIFTDEVVRIELEKDGIFVVLGNKARFSREKRVKLNHFEPAPEAKTKAEAPKTFKRKQRCSQCRLERDSNFFPKNLSVPRSPSVCASCLILNKRSTPPALPEIPEA